jgi:hypothetical protein
MSPKLYDVGVYERIGAGGMIFMVTVNIPDPPVELILIGQVYEPTLKPVVSIFTVITSCSPVELPPMGDTVTQLLDSLRL